MRLNRQARKERNTLAMVHKRAVVTFLYEIVLCLSASSFLNACERKRKNVDKEASAVRS